LAWGKAKNTEEPVNWSPFRGLSIAILARSHEEGEAQDESAQE